MILQINVGYLNVLVEQIILLKKYAQEILSFYQRGYILLIKEEKEFLQELADKAKTGQLTKGEELYITIAKRKNEIW